VFCNNSLHPCYKRSFHNQPSVASAAENERLGGTCASLLENVGINRCSRYLNAYAVFPAPSLYSRRANEMQTSGDPRREIAEPFFVGWVERSDTHRHPHRR
jgi:hypothetical protein